MWVFFFYILYHIYCILTPWQEVGIFFPAMMHGCSGGRFVPTLCCLQLLPSAASCTWKTHRWGCSHETTGLSSLPPRSHQLPPGWVCRGWHVHPFPQPASASAHLPCLLRCFLLCWDSMPADSLGQVFINLLRKMSSALHMWVYKAFWISVAGFWAFGCSLFYLSNIFFVVSGFKTQQQKTIICKLF